MHTHTHGEREIGREEEGKTHENSDIVHLREKKIKDEFI